MNASRPAPRAFISHTSSDKPSFVDEFAAKLRARGIDAWLAEWELSPGDSLVSKIFESGLSGTDAVIIVLSKRSVESKWVREELDAAVVRKIERQARLIPVKIEECKVPEALLHILWVDAAKLGMDATVSAVVDALFGHTKKPPLGAPPSYAEGSIAIRGLTNVDVAFLRVAYNRAVATESTQIGIGAMISGMAAEGVDERQVREAAEVLSKSGYIRANKALGAGVVAVWLENRGISAWLSASMREYVDLKKRSVFMVLNEGIHRAEVLAEGLGQSAIFANHLLEEMERRGLILLSREIGPYRLIARVEPELRRLAAQIDEQPGHPF